MMGKEIDLEFLEKSSPKFRADIFNCLFVKQQGKSLSNLESIIKSFRQKNHQGQDYEDSINHCVMTKVLLRLPNISTQNCDGWKRYIFASVRTSCHPNYFRDKDKNPLNAWLEIEKTTELTNEDEELLRHFREMKIDLERIVNSISEGRIKQYLELFVGSNSEEIVKKKLGVSENNYRQIKQQFINRMKELLKTKRNGRI